MLVSSQLELGCRCLVDRGEREGSEERVKKLNAVILSGGSGATGRHSEHGDRWKSV